MQLIIDESGATKKNSGGQRYPEYILCNKYLRTILLFSVF